MPPNTCKIGLVVDLFFFRISSLLSHVDDMARPTQSKKKLLILGGGAAGLLTAMKAGPAQDELGLEITLVDCKVRMCGCSCLY